MDIKELNFLGVCVFFGLVLKSSAHWTGAVVIYLQLVRFGSHTGAVYIVLCKRSGRGILTFVVEIYCIISGRVQGVRFRDYAQVSATELGLAGWVKNQFDGTVAVCAQGLPDTLKEYVEYLHEGSLSAQVDAVSVDWRTAKTLYEDFSIKF